MARVAAHSESLLWKDTELLNSGRGEWRGERGEGRERVNSCGREEPERSQSLADSPAERSKEQRETRASQPITLLPPSRVGQRVGIGMANGTQRSHQAQGRTVGRVVLPVVALVVPTTNALQPLQATARPLARLLLLILRRPVAAGAYFSPVWLSTTIIGAAATLHVRRQAAPPGGLMWRISPAGSRWCRNV